jgi:hypothetical protein
VRLTCASDRFGCSRKADNSRLSPSEADILNQNVIALIQHDRDDLAPAMKEADGVLSQNVAQKLAIYP